MRTWLFFSREYLDHFESLSVLFHELVHLVTPECIPGGSRGPKQADMLSLGLTKLLDRHGECFSDADAECDETDMSASYAMFSPQWEGCDRFTHLSFWVPGSVWWELSKRDFRDDGASIRSKNPLARPFG